MERGKQKIIAKAVGISDAFLSQILSGMRRPGWETAKKLAEATGVPEKIWLDGTPEEIRQKL